MSSEQCTCSQELVVDYSPTSFSGISQLSLLSGILTPAESLENEQQKDGSQDCTCGKEMSDCSIHPNTPEKWIASMQDSLAKTLALLESRQVFLREPDQVFTEKSCVLLTQYDQKNSSWRTLQQSFLTDSEQFSETWPRWGMTQGGSAYAHPMSERRITETGGSCWPTPDTRGFVNEGSLAMLSRMCATHSEYVAMGYRAAAGKKAMFWPTPTVTTGAQVAWSKTPGQTGGTSLAGAVRFWPTPTAHNAKECNAKSESQRNTPTLAAQAGGKLNPNWVGWLMGFPIGWANSKVTGMHKFRSKQPQHIDCSKVKEAA